MRKKKEKMYKNYLLLIFEYRSCVCYDNELRFSRKIVVIGIYLYDLRLVF